jgi:sec-independent protein translocase protein TatB
MFNIGSGELVLIAVVALLVLGPKRLPELARGLGKFLREFRRQTDEVRGVVEREFYKMDQEMDAPVASLPQGPPADTTAITAADGAVPMEGEAPLDPNDHSDPRHPDYGKDDPHGLPADPPISHHVDPTPAQPAETSAAPAPALGDPEKKAS